MRTHFFSADGQKIPAVTEDEMREVDRIAVQEFHLGVLQMMENAGRNLAAFIHDNLAQEARAITILAGSGGNGGGGLCCARHLHNHGHEVHLLLTKHPPSLAGPAGTQYAILASSGMTFSHLADAEKLISEAVVVVDALLGYSLQGEPRGTAAQLIETCNRWAEYVVALDIPSGVDATSGETPGLSVRTDTTVTLALPKKGLDPSRYNLYLSDIGIPPEVYLPLGLNPGFLFRDNFLLQLTSRDPR